MIVLMRDARLRVSEAAELTWGDVERVRGGSGRARVVEASEEAYKESVNAARLRRETLRDSVIHEIGLRASTTR